MAELIDLAKISKAIVGLADLIGKLAKSIETAINSGIRSADALRKRRERRRLENFILLTAHLYPQQGRFVSSLDWFAQEPDRGTWEGAKYEILAVSRLLNKIEKYVLPYNDALVAKHRKNYLEILTALSARRQLLDYVYYLEYDKALKHIPELKKIAKAYLGLQNRLQEILLNLNQEKDPDAIEPSYGLIDIQAPLTPLQSTGATKTKRKGSKRIPLASNKLLKRGRS